jgi:hypothetical protein
MGSKLNKNCEVETFMNFHYTAQDNQSQNLTRIPFKGESDNGRIFL